MFKIFTFRYFGFSISLRRCWWGGGWAIASISFLSFSRWPGTEISHRHRLYLYHLRNNVYKSSKGCIEIFLHYRDDEREDDLERRRLLPRSFVSSPYLLYFFLERDFVFSCFTFLSGEFKSVRPIIYILIILLEGNDFKYHFMNICISKA